MIKVGMLVECGRDGLEVHVCHRLCQLLGEHFGMQFIMYPENWTGN
jgi:hypothetical protein